ncbi:MAG: hypothetical protein KF691_03385 [Phycisphaeraceae bacterium]|nr:hypothetical protein [Phycisphaeraceae bacterium]
MSNEFEGKVRAGFKDVASSMQLLQSQTRAIQKSQEALVQVVVALANGAPKQEKAGGVTRKFLEILNTFAAVVIALVLLSVVLWAIPEANSWLRLIAKSSGKPDALAGVVIDTVTKGTSLSSDDKNQPVRLTHALIIRVPAITSSEADKSFIELHKILNGVGGWNRWRIERKSDRPDDADKGLIAEKYMYFVALAKDQVVSTTRQLMPLLENIFPTDHMLITVSLSDSETWNSINPTAAIGQSTSPQ